MGLIMLVALIGFYFLPWIVAAQRGRVGHVWIGVFNILFGWTVIGWLILLVVAFTGETETGRHERAEELRLLRQMANQQGAKADSQY